MFTESVEDWLMISLDDDFFNQHRRYFTHVAHHCLHDAAGDPLPSFRKVGWRKLWRKSDTASRLQGIYSPFLNRDYSSYYKCVQSAIERIWSSLKITTCISVVPGKFPTFMTSFLTLWHHPPEGPFSPDGSHIFPYYIFSWKTCDSLLWNGLAHSYYIFVITKNVKLESGVKKYINWCRMDDSCHLFHLFKIAVHMSLENGNWKRRAADPTDPLHK